MEKCVHVRTSAPGSSSVWERKSVSPQTSRWTCCRCSAPSGLSAPTAQCCTVSGWRPRWSPAFDIHPVSGEKAVSDSVNLKNVMADNDHNVVLCSSPLAGCWRPRFCPEFRFVDFFLSLFQFREIKSVLAKLNTDCCFLKGIRAIFGSRRATISCLNYSNQCTDSHWRGAFKGSVGINGYNLELYIFLKTVLGCNLRKAATSSACF